MRLGILSDTHDRIEPTRLAVATLTERGADVLIHCGDMTGPEIVELFSALPSYFALGNNDSDNVPALRKAIAQIGATCLDWGGVVTLAGNRIGIVHGHMRSDVRRLLATSPDYLFSGHSHEPADFWEGTTRRINPGALFRASELTVALLDTETTDLTSIVIPK